MSNVKYTAIHCKTLDDLRKVSDTLIKSGAKWANNSDPNLRGVYVAYGEKAAIMNTDGELTHGELFDAFNAGYNIMTAEQFLDGFVPKDTVDHPEHYQSNGMEVIDVIDAFELNFNLGNTFKYIARAGKKGDELEDLKKAVWYLNHEIETREEAE